MRSLSGASSVGQIRPIFTVVEETPVLDAAHLDALRRLGTPPDGVLPELAGLFLRDAPIDLAGLAAAVAADDRERAARLAHRLKGMGGHVGATRFSLAARGLEQAAAAPGGSSLDGHLAALRAAFDEVETALGRVIQT